MRQVGEWRMRKNGRLLLWSIGLFVLGMFVPLTHAQPDQQLDQSDAASVESDWSRWSGRLPIEVHRTRPDRAGLLPIEVTFALPVDSMADAARPRRELRLVYSVDDQTRRIPFQLSGLSVRRKDTESESVPTLTGQVTFLEVTPYESEGRYLLLYGNDEASPPQFKTDLTVRGSGPGWTIENSTMIARLQGYRQGGAGDSEAGAESGHLSSITLKSHPDQPLTNDGGTLHWNPGIAIPERGWIHTFDWDPPEQIEIERGPLFVEVRRSGAFPKIREARLEVTYRFYKNRSYVWSGTRVHIDEDLGVMALRNDELVFDPSLFTDLAWKTDGELHRASFDEYEPVNQHGDILRIEDDAQMVAFYNPRTQIGAATVRLSSMNVGPMASSPTQFDQATYIVDSENLTYWSRSLVYLHAKWPRKRLITVPAESEYVERNLYCFHDTSQWGLVRRVERIASTARQEPDVRVEPYEVPLPR